MKVEITDRFTLKTYIAAQKADCKDEIDKQVFEMVQRYNDAITMGAVIGVPERFFTK